ncbi:MAG TPA: SDR family oxidoreductase [Steroidobacteraceae bacterium]|jgi:NAD(P)-dependent dehydrogenase (short-subunit alcohol dehydrogenase family)|nr:SDR family oxidoreductase [Steroidobacteraceae bacterium]
MGKLDGKVAVITGGSSGMALATAKRFVEEGAYVFITGRRQEALDEAVKLIGRNVTGVRADSAKLADLDRLYEKVKSEKGHIDILFASAGGGDVTTPIGAYSEKVVDDMLNLNVRGTLFTVQKALPLLRDGSSIILNASNAHLKGYAGASVYAAAKAAVRSFARSWANDLKDRKIRVNSISPGAIGDTAAFAAIPKETTDFFVSLVPMGRMGRSDEIAAAVLYLASDESRFTTAIDLVVDGGMSQV